MTNEEFLPLLISLPIFIGSLVCLPFVAFRILRETIKESPRKKTTAYRHLRNRNAEELPKNH